MKKPGPEPNPVLSGCLMVAAIIFLPLDIALMARLAWDLEGGNTGIFVIYLAGLVALSIGIIAVPVYLARRWRKKREE